MKYITRQEAHLKSRFLNESLEEYTILDEEVKINEEICVLINDKEMFEVGLHAYVRKNDVLKILNNYNKSVLTDIYAFNEAYKNTFPNRDDNGIMITEGVISKTIAEIIHVILGTVGFASATGVGEIADAVDFSMYTGQGLMSLKEGDDVGAAVKFVQALLSIVSLIPGSDSFTKPIMAVAGSTDKAKLLVDNLPEEWKKSINARVQELLKDTSFEQKINQKVVEFKKTAKKEGASGAIGQGIDNTVGKVPLVGGVLGKVVKTGTFLHGKGLDLVIGAANKAGFDPIEAIPDNLGTLLMNAFKEFANEVFTQKGSITQPIRDVLKPKQKATNQQLPVAAMRNRS